MLDIERITPAKVERADSFFHRDGFVVLTDVLTDQQFESVHLR